MLSELKERGKKLAIATNKRTDYTMILLDKIGLLQYFDTIKAMDMNRADDEGNRIFQQISKVVNKIRKQLKTKQYDALIEIIKEIKNGNMTRFFRDTNRLEECTPNVACFSTCSFRRLYKGGEKSNWLLEKDCCLHMDCNNFELEILNIDNFDENGQMSAKCYNAIEFVKVQYDDNVIMDHFESLILNYFNTSPDYAINEIKNWIQIARFSILPEEYSSEKETRLIIYLPNNLDEHPKIKNYIKNQHLLSKDDEIVGEGKRESDYIYLNITKDKAAIWGDYNPGSFYKHDIEDYNTVIEKAGFIPLMFDPTW